MNPALVTTKDVEKMVTQLPTNHQAATHFRTSLQDHFEKQLNTSHLHLYCNDTHTLTLRYGPHEWVIHTDGKSAYSNQEEKYKREEKILTQIFGEAKTIIQPEKIQQIPQQLPKMIKATKLETLSWITNLLHYLYNYYTKTEQNHIHVFGLLTQTKYGEDMRYVNLVAQKIYLNEQQYHNLVN